MIVGYSHMMELVGYFHGIYHGLYNQQYTTTNQAATPAPIPEIFPLKGEVSTYHWVVGSFKYSPYLFSVSFLFSLALGMIDPIDSYFIAWINNPTTSQSIVGQSSAVDDIFPLCPYCDFVQWVEATRPDRKMVDTSMEVIILLPLIWMAPLVEPSMPFILIPSPQYEAPPETV